MIIIVLERFGGLWNVNARIQCVLIIVFVQFLRIVNIFSVFFEIHKECVVLRFSKLLQTMLFCFEHQIFCARYFVYKICALLTRSFCLQAQISFSYPVGFYEQSAVLKDTTLSDTIYIEGSSRCVCSQV